MRTFVKQESPSSIEETTVAAAAAQTERVSPIIIRVAPFRQIAAEGGHELVSVLVFGSSRHVAAGKTHPSDVAANRQIEQWPASVPVPLIHAHPCAHTRKTRPRGDGKTRQRAT